MMDNTVSWKGHINKILPRMSPACYIIRGVKPFKSQDILKMIHYPIVIR